MPNEHILLVDDDPIVLKSLARFLTRRGYRVTQAEGGKEALEEIGKAPPDLVLLDVMMPGMDGVKTLEEIRNRFGDLRVVMISALKDEKIAHKTIEMGALEWLPKPFSLENLEATILLTLMKGEEGGDKC